MSANLTAFLYLVSGVLFILALRGLSNPETSRRGNQLIRRPASAGCF
jgi:NAD(P) transhydrogenase subunit beta